MIKPNFFIVGSMKSGTSSMHSLLNQHPEIHMSHIKEPSYFVDRKSLKKLYPSMYSQSCSNSLPAYLELFESEKSNVTIYGESSSNYAKYPHTHDVAKAIYDYNPNAKVLFVLKNPIERALSHYWHAVRNDNEVLPIDKAIKVNKMYLDVSDYRMQIEQYRKYFDDSRIKIIILEEFNLKPDFVMDDIFEWLGVSAFRVANPQKRVHLSPNIISAPKNCIGRYFNNSKLKNLVKKIVPTFLHKRISSVYQVSINKHDVEIDGARAFLKSETQSSIDKLEKILGRDICVWNKVNEKNV